MTVSEIVITGKDASYLGFAVSFAKRFNKSPVVRDFQTYFGVKATTVKKRLKKLEEQNLAKLWPDGHVDVSDNIRLTGPRTELKPLPQHEALLAKLLNQVHELLQEQEQGENQFKHYWQAVGIGISGDEDLSFRLQTRLLDEGFVREACSHSRCDALAEYLDPDELFACQFDLDHAIRAAWSGRNEMTATTAEELAHIWKQVMQPVLDVSLQFRQLYEELLSDIERRLEFAPRHAYEIETIGAEVQATTINELTADVIASCCLDLDVENLTPAQKRNIIFAVWSDDMTPAKIRDRWINEFNDPPLTNDKKGREVVTTGIKRGKALLAE